MRLVILLLLCPFFIFAQSGPGGSGNTDASSNLIVWLKADDGPTITSTAINGIKLNTWADQSGHQIIGLPHQLEQRPTYKFNAINELYPTISFDGKDDFLQLSILENPEEDEEVDDDDDDDDDENENQITDPFSVKNDFAIIFVAKADVIHDTDPMSNMEDGTYNGLDYQKYVLAPSYRNGGNEAGFGISLGTNGIAAYEYGFNYFPAINAINNNPPNFIIGNEFHIFMIQVENKKSVIAMDGEIIGEGLPSSIGHLFVPNEIGGGSTNALANFDNFFEGELAELIMYANGINAAEQIAIQNYLAAKYGIELAQNDLYQMDNPENGNYDHDVAGIGKRNNGHSLLESKGTGVVCFSNPSDLDNGEYLFWGNTKVGFDNLATERPEGAEAMLATTWAVSEIGEIGTMDICFSHGMFVDVNPEDLRLVIDTNGDGSFLDEEIPLDNSANTIIIDTENEEVTFTNQNLNDGDLFTFASRSSLNPLPISLVSFRANVVANKTIDLSWTTESESNNEYFTIERSTDSRDFSPIGMVEGKGTTELTQSYQLTDHQPFRGDNYYRIKQVDYDGNYTYSNIIKATIEVDKEDIFVFPNPTIDELTIQLPNAAIDDLMIQVYDANGKLVFSEKKIQSALSNVKINPKLNPGIYFLRLRARNYVGGERFVVSSDK